MEEFEHVFRSQVCLVVCSPSTCQVEAVSSLSGIVSLKPTWDIWDSVSKTQNHKEIASGNQGYTFMCKELGLSRKGKEREKGRRGKDGKGVRKESRQHSVI